MDKIYQSLPYNNVAIIYPHIMRKVRYDYWADYIYSITSHFIGSKPRILELASGNCHLANFLSDYYPRYVATDMSVAMLRSDNKFNLKKVCCDMKMIPFKYEFDLIVSAFDSVNYLVTKKDLSSLFKEIVRILSQKGLFTFDVSLEKNSYRHVKDAIRKGTYKGLKYQQETEFDPKTRIHRNLFYITYPDGNTFKEVHIQKIHSFNTYFELMNSAGLVVRECFDAFTYKDGKESSARVQFIAMKK